MRMRGVPLVEQFVQDLGDPVVDRVAETGQELLAGPDVEDLSAGPGRAGGWRRLPARMPGCISGRRRAGWRAGGLHLRRPSACCAALRIGLRPGWLDALSLEPLLDFLEDLLQ